MTLLQNARGLRQRMTDAEKRLWQHLRDRRLLGLKFRRQRPIGPYIVDFLCLEQRVVIEVDGGQHLDCPHDARRDDYLRSQGFRVICLWNNEVLSQTDAVLEHLRASIETASCIAGSHSATAACES